jgi:hypothetical protein
VKLPSRLSRGDRLGVLTMSTPLFSKRHYEWIAAFCREHLTGMDCVTLAEA